METLLFTRKRKTEEGRKTGISNCEAEPDKGG